MTRILDQIKAALSGVHYFLKRAFLFPVEIYRKYFSGLKAAPSCRFSPTCSSYAVDAVMEWGIIVGSILALCRVIRCNPFSAGGYDPVPKKKDTFEKIKRIFIK